MTRWTEASEDVTPSPTDEEREADRRRFDVAEGLRATRPHAHKASPLLTETLPGGTRIMEHCACGCSRVVAFKGARREPQSWT